MVDLEKHVKIKLKEYSMNTLHKKIKKRKTIKYSSLKQIPIVVICWNNYYFVKNFINQLKRFPNPIILLDNKSNYKPLLDYYKKIKSELKDKIEIRMLDKNYGHTVYKQLKNILPDIYILSDPDLELNSKLPKNFATKLLELSNQYKCYKIGCALKIDDNHKFIHCDNYTSNKNIYEWEKQFWVKPIMNNKYELYQADIDTTLCLINNNYVNSEYNIRVAGNFTAKHLPWYNNYIKDNISSDEITNWKQNNKSSSILFNCLKL
uniref:Glycosyltransferase 2-like domain-containing protein n=1 Tax=viral metagenome TaxID=1070528 RepID=A0A6C0B8B7_9ZZZZ